jgi:hypothetical protein
VPHVGAFRNDPFHRQIARRCQHCLSWAFEVIEVAQYRVAIGQHRPQQAAAGSRISSCVRNVVTSIPGPRGSIATRRSRVPITTRPNATFPDFAMGVTDDDVGIEAGLTVGR